MQVSEKQIMREPATYFRSSNVGSSRGITGISSGGEEQGKRQGYDSVKDIRNTKINQAAACGEHTVVRSDNHGKTVTRTLITSQDSEDVMMHGIEMNVGDHFNDPLFDQGCGDVDMVNEVVSLDDHHEVGFGSGV